MNPELADYYPDWLGSELLWSDFPWEQGISTTLPAFFQEYTLHDSNWIALHLDPGQSAEAVLAIRWDAFWSEGRIPHPGSRVAEWPILLIKLHRLRGLRLEKFTGEWSPRTISQAACVMAPEEAVHITEISDIVDGSILLEHEPEVTLLCLTPTRELLPIPDLDVPDAAPPA